MTEFTDFIVAITGLLTIIYTIIVFFSNKLK
nr:MAG TPA: HCMV UL42 [Caudoviricetes sp.]